MLPALTNEEIRRYSRHLLVPEIGMDGQRKIKAGSALIVGLGGLGSPIALYLAAAGVGRIGLIDHDTVETSNLQRQVIHGGSQAGRPKVFSARERLADLNPRVQIDAYHAPFSRENALEIAREYDILIDGCDNFATRYLLNDVAVLTGKPMVYGSVFGFDGQVSVFYAPQGPCYRCVFPDAPPPANRPSGVLGPVPGVIGTLQTVEALKLLSGAGEALIGRLLLYSAYEQSFETVQIKKNPQCKICGEHPLITHLLDDYGQPWQRQKAEPLPAEWEIRPQELAQLLRRGADLRLIDVREPFEVAIGTLPGAENIPLETLPRRLETISPQDDILLVCLRGQRSGDALRLLRQAGFRHVRHLSGGLEAWAQEVDSDFPVY